MNDKKFIKYLIYIITIGILYYLGTIILAAYNKQAQITYTHNYWLITLVSLLFYGGIGVVLGLDKFLIELKHEGKWKFDIIKLIILGIPSLIFSIPYLVISVISLQASFSNIFTISPIIFGYTLISSLSKDNK